MAQKVLIKSAVKREKNKFYFIDGKGNLVSTDRNTKGGKKGRTISCRAKSTKKKTTKRKTSGKKKTTKKVTINMRKSPAKKKKRASKKR